MNVLRTIRVFYPHVTGPANQAYFISKGLLDHGVVSSVFTVHHSEHDAANHEVMDGFPVYRLREGAGVMAYRMLKDASSLLAARADLIHVHCYRDRLCTLASGIARRDDLPLIIQPHGALSMYRHIVNGWRRWPYQLFDLARFRSEILAADRIVVATQQEAEEAIECGVSSERVVVIPVGATPISDGQRHRPGQHDCLRLLFVGRLSPGRNVDVLLRALALVKRKHPHSDFSLDIVGPAESRSATQNASEYVRELKSYAHSNGLAGHVQFTGPLFGQELTQRYRDSDVFLYASHYENFGQTVLEAAAQGCVLMATPTGVSADLIQDEVSGYLIDPNDENVLADRLMEVFSDRTRLPGMADRTLELVRTNYCWESITEKYSLLYRQLKSLDGGKTETA